MIAPLRDWLDWLGQSEYGQAVHILMGAVAAALVTRLVVMPNLRRLARKTETELDDHALFLVWPAFLRTILLHCLKLVGAIFVADAGVQRALDGIAVTLIILIWTRVAIHIGEAVWQRLCVNAEKCTWIQPQTLPLTQFTYKVMVFGISSYLIMSAWQVNLTSWLASAGVAGIALGFAAKDTLANFISGIFILVDAPYRVGQYIIIDGTTRGVVTEIGMRSTRLLTRDNVEVTIPNAVIGNAKIVNESSGPSPKIRVRVNVGVAYGSDVEQVREILLGCARDLAHASDGVEPAVRFTAMGASSLDFQILVWVKHPALKGRMVDSLNTNVYLALQQAGVEIPFPQQDLHLKSWPAQPPPYSVSPAATSTPRR